MNPQKGKNPIEWTDFTSNPIGGCLHDCKWDMPNGEQASCYADAAATGIAKAAYAQGFAHHYWRPTALVEPLKRRMSAKIFLGSMADMFGPWVPEDQIMAVLKMCEQAHWHTFQVLTKNAPRLLQFKDRFPPNVWVGASTPPSSIRGKELNAPARVRMFVKTLEILSQIDVPVVWMSMEPLPEHFAIHLQDHGLRANGESILKWAVIGAASRGDTVFQPSALSVRNMLTVLDMFKVPVFFKGNLRGNGGIDRWRQEFPVVPKIEQTSLF